MITVFLFSKTGLYFGQPRGFKQESNGERTGYNTMVYSTSEVFSLSSPSPDISGICWMNTYGSIEKNDVIIHLLAESIR